MTARDFIDSSDLKLEVWKLTSSYADWTFTNEDIIRNSISFKQTLINKLESGSSTITLSLKVTPSSNILIAYQDELKAFLKVGDTTLFAGYLSNKISTKVNTYGFDAISITLEDRGIKLFKKELYPDSLVDHYFSGSLKDLVALIYTQLDNSFTYDTSTITNDNRAVSSIIKSGTTVESILKKVTKELCYVYYWNSSGTLCFYKIPEDGDSTGNIEAFACKDNQAISIDREIRKYNSARVSCTSYENASGILVYQDVSGGDGTGDCNITIPANTHYPDSENGLPAEYTCEDLVNGKEIINVDNLQPNVIWRSTGSGPTISIEKKGNNTITVDIYNNTSYPVYLTKLECTADITRIASTEVVKTSINGAITSSDSVIEVDCEWLHNKDYLPYLARVTGNYYKYCDTKYTFYTLDELQNNEKSPFDRSNTYVGSVVTLKDTSVSGLNTTVLVTAVNVDTSTNLVKYEAVGYSKFNMDTSIIDNTVYKQNTTAKGEKGEKGEDGKPSEEIKVGYVTVTPPSFEYNRRSTDDILIRAVVEVHGLNTTELPTVSVTPCKSLSLESSYVDTLYQEVEYKVTLSADTPYTSISWSTIDSTLGGTYEVVGIDVTEYNMYIGKFDNTSSVTVKALDGDCMFSKDNSLLYIRQNGSWVTFSSSTLSDELKSNLAAQAQRDVLSTVSSGTIVSAEYAYLSNIVSNTVTTNALTMTESGIIQSEGITSSSVGTDGYLTKDGYRLEGKSEKGNGTLRAKNAYINDLNCQGATLINATIAGELTGKYINTVAVSSGTSTFSIAFQQAIYENSEVRHWLVVDWAGLRFDGKAAFVEGVSGSVYGFTFSNYTVYANTKQWGNPYGLEGYDYKYLTRTTRYWNLNYYTTASDSSDFISYAGQQASDRKTLFPDGTTYAANDESHRIIVKDSSGNTVLDTTTTPLQYVTVTTSMTSQFKKLGTNGIASCSGTVTGGGKSISGNMTVLRGANSTTFSQGSTSITIPDSGKFYGGNIYVNVSYSTSRVGVEVNNIYASGTDVSIGEATRYFKSAYITTVNSDTVSANTLYGTLGNDLADCIPVDDDAEIEVGYCYCFDGEKYYKSTKYLDEGFVGIQSDTYGMHIGSEHNSKHLDVAVTGFALAHVDKEYITGTPLTCGEDGYLTEINMDDKVRYPERIVATYWKNETATLWKDIPVNGRKWVKIR